NILHRDIAPGFDESGHVIIGDFGLSKVFDLVSYLVSGCCGMPSHMAPKMLFQEKYGFSVDYWALAVTIYEMLTGRVCHFSH
ncbi:kinase-like domain-containing protein, partial [Melanogaster broomeanus]